MMRCAASAILLGVDGVEQSMWTCCRACGCLDLSCTRACTGRACAFSQPQTASCPGRRPGHEAALKLIFVAKVATRLSYPVYSTISLRSLSFTTQVLFNSNIGTAIASCIMGQHAIASCSGWGPALGHDLTRLNRHNCGALTSFRYSFRSLYCYL
ncbi:uncharacterized protein EDB91DRAFT_1152892 [Suillus paluster]|uniref:uncharacterized protein n=1 Tax=Suillus paluster TaxID=48578 RepID=UPI001B87367D|nr:uncharacterized protein EDB91DRAFT_1152892 [Suillus paluster]KAG1732011.1 hypothetical protein EDB91DRAFT_1152892 [Suillus paluster]